MSTKTENVFTSNEEIISQSQRLGISMDKGFVNLHIHVICNLQPDYILIMKNITNIALYYVLYIQMTHISVNLFIITTKYCLQLL